MEPEAVRSVVTAHPDFSGWLLVACATGLVWLIVYLWKQEQRIIRDHISNLVAQMEAQGEVLAKRLAEQDKVMREIRDLQLSEVGKLREMQHDLDKRVIRIESQCRIHGKYAAEE